jgi:hypothetical protein
LAVFRTPSAAVTAHIVDRELGLHDRTVSALQFSSADDEISRLVVAEGAARLAEQNVSRLPFAITPAGKWLPIAMASLFALVFVTRESPRSPGPELLESGHAVTTASQPSRDQASRPATPGSSEFGAQSSAGSPVAEADRGAQPAREGHAPTVAGQTTGAAAEATKRAGNLPQTPATSTSASGSVSSETRGGATGASAVRGQGVTANASAASGAGRGAGVPGGGENATGGVSGGDLAHEGATRMTAEPVGVVDRRTTSYAAAYSRAESATAAEHVPVPLRSYVRAYFLAIRPAANR